MNRFTPFVFAMLGLVAGWNPASAADAVLGQPLIVQSIDDANLVKLEGNTRPEAIAVNDRGALAADFRIEHMSLELRRSPAQDKTVEAAVAALQDRASPTYHHWLTASEYGARFGVAQSDIDKVTAWLQGQGFTVDFVYPTHMVIEFSGTAGQVTRAFHTEMHQIEIGGAYHIANMSDPRIPVALAPAVEGIVSLNDFHPHSHTIRRPRVTGSCQGSPCYAVGAGDLATIYNLKDLFQQGISGQGEVIAAVEDTNLYNNADWTNFRSAFGLKSYTAGKLLVAHPGPANGKACGNPGVTSDDGEATLDVEWATAAAPSATIELASCADGQVNSGIYIAIQNLINSNAPPPTISVSYGICEADNGAASNASFNKLYQAAVAQGISVFVATGDDGPTDCASNSNGTTYGIGINGWGDSQYNVAVGGTDFGDVYAGTTAKYWRKNAGAPWSTAISYIPEIAWNGTCGSVLLAQYYGGTSTTYGANGFCNSATGSQFLGLGGGEGGPSGCYSGVATVANVVSGSCKGYPKPSWQKGVVGIPADGVRDVPDVAMFASNGIWTHSLATCFTDPDNGGGACTGNPANWAANAGGTSYATPIMAAIQALVDQSQGGPVGNPAPIYYQLAAKEYGTGAKGKPACYASQGSNTASTCVFHDVVTGDDITDCRGTHNCFRPSGTYGVLSTSDTAYKPAYKTTIGYDFPTGLGSVDAFNLVYYWPQ